MPVVIGQAAPMRSVAACDNFLGLAVLTEHCLILDASRVTHNLLLQVYLVVPG